MIILDCPPNFSTLSENIFKAADEIVVPVIPTTLSERTFDQLVGFFDKQQVVEEKAEGILFDGAATQDPASRDDGEDAQGFIASGSCKATIPFAADIEKDGARTARRSP